MESDLLPATHPSRSHGEDNYVNYVEWNLGGRACRHWVVRLSQYGASSFRLCIGVCSSRVELLRCWTNWQGL